MAKKITKPEPQAKEKAPETKAVARVDTSKQLAKPTGKKLAGRGFENLELSDVLLPRIKLLQNGSPEVVAETAKAGDIFVTLSGENFGNKGIILTPIMHFRSRIKWIDKDAGGGIDCSSPDAKIPRDPNKYAQTCVACAHKDWNNDAKTNKAKQPQCTIYENFLVLVNDQVTPLLLPLEKTKIKIAKKLYSMGALTGGDMWDHTYKLGTEKVLSENDEPFQNYTIAASGKKTSDERRALCETFWNSMVGKTVSEQNAVNDDQPAGEPAAAGSGKY